jgi:hypothetical protein
VDIDVFCNVDLEPSREQLEPRLKAMRLLKNEAFFGTFTAKAVEEFK